MYFSSIGIDHHCDAQTREKFAFSDTQKVEFSAILEEQGIFENVILSTCNRSEVYAFAKDRCDLTAVIAKAYCAYFHVDSGAVDFVCHEGRDAVTHIFRVAAGLESAIVGEDEILRQVKESFENSRRLGYTGKVLNHLFQAALRCAKEIKSSLKISEIPISPGYIGLKFLEREAGSFAGKHLLLLGFGEIGQKFYRYAREYDFGRVTICNRSEERALSIIGNDTNALYRPFAQWRQELPAADIVITATHCPHLILKKEAMAEREKPLYLLDMSIPRNIDQGIGGLPQYHLFNIDALTEIANENMAARRELCGDAETIIVGYVEEFFLWLGRLKEDEVIESLNQSVDLIMENHLDYLFSKIAVNDKEKSIISRTMRAAMKKALMNPIVTLKSMEDKEKRQIYSEIMEELFGLHQEA